MVIAWNEFARELERGSKGSSTSISSSSSSGWVVEDLRGVDERESRLCSGNRGAAIARLDVARGELWAQRSGDGVSARKRAPGLDDAAERGRGMGLNSEAFAFRSRGDEMGEAGRLAVYCAETWACMRMGEEEGE
jgi:hypothetical protein